jgi:hypothetical protein
LLNPAQAGISFAQFSNKIYEEFKQKGLGELSLPTTNLLYEFFAAFVSKLRQKLPYSFIISFCTQSSRSRPISVD